MYGVAPWVNSAYGKNTRNISAFLKEFFDVEMAVYYGLQGSSLNYNDMMVHACPGKQQDSDAWAEYWFMTRGIDVIFQHFDTWILPAGWIVDRELPVVTYAPVDSVSMSYRSVQAMRGALMNVAMSKFTQERLKEQNLPNVYIPHGVDTGIYKPQDRKKCRKSLGLPTDRFILGCVSTNESARKNIPNQLLAYKRFLNKNPEAADYSLFYLHAATARGHFFAHDLNTIIYELGLSKNVIYTEKRAYRASFDEEKLVRLYNSFDVLMQATLGEGFGLPIIEAGACGIPTIGSDFSAIPEVMGKGGILVETILGVPWQELSVWQRVPVLEKITEAIDLLYNDGEKRGELSKLAYENAKRYEMQKVGLLWVQLFKDLGGQFGWK